MVNSKPVSYTHLAVVFCTFGFFYLKGRGKGKFVRRFVPTMRGASEGDVKGD